MNGSPLRSRTARAYTWLLGLVTLEVVLQAFLFSAFYGRGEAGFIDAHGIAGELTGYIVVLIATPLAFAARFPRRARIGWLTLLLALLWSIQAHFLGYGIRQIGTWLAMLHIPLAFVILGLGAYLTIQAWRLSRARVAEQVAA